MHYFDYLCHMEELMQYVWRFRLWPPSVMVTVDGMRVDVIDPGELNRGSGPDFFNAKICIGGQMWIGNVEIHVRASDWMRHGHGSDRAYDNVVLHVVEVDDCPVYRTDGQLIPQMVMRCAADFSQRYARMVDNPALELACASELPGVPQINVQDWICALGYERLQAKADRILELARSGAGWTEAIYITLARALGFGNNSQPMELLARSTPLKALLRHSDDAQAVEAMLFGQAGLLAAQEECEDAYVRRLCADYAFYSAKYGLHPSAGICWKTARMRPQNFPHRRIAALARLVGGGFRFGSAVLSATAEEEARGLFDLRLDGYWARHYSLGDSGIGSSPRAFSYASASVLIINVVAPLLYAFGQETGDTCRQEAAADLLHRLKPEQNSIVEIFARAGLAADSAFASQALIQLRREYCVPRKCLFCRIGHRLLSHKAVR